MHTANTRNTLTRLGSFIVLIGLTFTFVFSQNTVHTYAGIGFPGFTNGDTSIAAFDTPHGIVLDATGNLYIADGGNHVIRKITTGGTVSTLAGTGQPGYVDGPSGFARFNDPYNICIDPAGNVFVSDFLNQRIRKISTSGIVSTVAGTGVAGYLDGPDSIAQFNYPRGICIDASGNLYVSDSWNHRIRKITPGGMVSTWAGGGTSIGVQSVGGYVDAADTSARFYTPTEISIDSNNNIFVADAFNHRIRKIDGNQVVSTVAGSGISGQSGGGFQNGPGNQALFDTPTAVHVSYDGIIFVGDGSSHRVRIIDSTNNVSTFAGSGSPGFSNGIDSLATFNFPRATAMDPARNRLYVVDVNNNAIRYIQGPFTAIPEISSGWITAFPNPFSDRISIHTELITGAFSLAVYDLLGQEIIARKGLGGGLFNLDMTTLAPGSYYLVIHWDGHNTVVRHLVKETKN